jgi:hypothetical protein
VTTAPASTAVYLDHNCVASEAEEQALIDAGAIQSTGFRYVGERPATETT